MSVILALNDALLRKRHRLETLPDNNFSFYQMMPLAYIIKELNQANCRHLGSDSEVTVIFPRHHPKRNFPIIDLKHINSSTAEYETNGVD